MSKKTFALVLFVYAITALPALTLTPATTEASRTGADAARIETAGACGDALQAPTESPDPLRVPPGCCTSNCTTDRDCNRICGKGNCVCLVESDCCRRCTY